MPNGFLAQQTSPLFARWRVTHYYFVPSSASSIFDRWHLSTYFMGLSTSQHYYCPSDISLVKFWTNSVGVISGVYVATRKEEYSPPENNCIPPDQAQ